MTAFDGRQIVVRRGMSRVGVLVTIAAAWSFIGCGIPSAVFFRDQARLDICRNNLRSLAIATQAYESTKRRLPAATDRNAETSRAAVWKEDKTASGYSWLFHVLPYREEVNLYNTVAMNTSKLRLGPFSVGQKKGSDGAWGGDTHAAALVVPWLTCPLGYGVEDIEAMDQGPSKGLSYGPEYRDFAESVEADGIARTSYKAMAGTHMVDGMPASNGVIQLQPDTELHETVRDTPWFACNRGISFGAIADGTSKTVLLVETDEQGYSSWIDGTTGWLVAYDPNLSVPQLVNGEWRKGEGDDARVTQSALGVAPSLDPPAQYLPTKLFTNRVKAGIAFGPSSSHMRDGVAHAFVDSRIVLLSPGIDGDVYLRLCSRNGGEHVEVPGE